jgi:elongation factor G
LPSPLDVAAVEGINPKTEEQEVRRTADDEHFCALCFKVMTDPFVGKLTFFRVYSGCLASGTYVYNANKDIKERINKLVQMHANSQEVRTEVYAGDIVAAVGLKETTTGDTICSEKHPVVLEAIKIPEPVMFMAIEAQTKADQEKLSKGLFKLSEEDPSFRTKYDQATSQTIISGMGELHLEVLIERLKEEFKVGVNVGRPQVSYKETIEKHARSEVKFVQQTGGRGQYGHVVIEVSPNSRSKGIEFINEISGGVIPKEFISAVKAGILNGAESGVLAGYPVTDIIVRLIDGSYHPVDSSELAFRMAAVNALRKALMKGNAVLLEPIMRLEVIIPEEYLGDVIGDLNSRRSDIKDMSSRGNTKIIEGFVPLAELFGYSTVIRSLTQGRGSYIMEPSFYDRVPAELVDKVIGA